MTFSRLFLACALSTAMSVAGPGIGFAQDLSEASLTMTSDWSGGYMGLGGSLGQAIVRHHRAKVEKPGKTARSTKAHRYEVRVKLASYDGQGNTPSFLIARSLDPTGLNIGMLRTRTRGP